MNQKRSDEFAKLLRAYAGFQMATALVVVAKSGDVRHADIVLTLFAISIPGTVLGGFMSEKDAERHPFAKWCVVAALYISIATLTLILCSASVAAGVTFAASCIFFILAAAPAITSKKKRGIRKGVKPPDDTPPE